MKDPRIGLEFRSGEEATAKGGVFAIKAFAQECGLWKRIEAEADLDPRKDKSKGYDPKAYVATFLFGFSTGGASMADFERLNDEPGLKRFLGIKRFPFPDETTLGQWLRGIGQKGAKRLRCINRDFIAWALERIDKGRILHNSQLDWFFDDTQLEVTGKCFESATLNYEGNTALSWQTLWAGPFLAAACWGAGSRDCSELLPEQLEQCAEVMVRWRDGKQHRAQHAWMRYQPSGCDQPQLFAVTRHQLAQGELFWRYAFICCESQRDQSPQVSIERHKLKGDKERQFSQVLRDLDMHHPPCKSLAANQVFYALGSLVHNLLQAIKLIHLPDHEQPIRIRTLLHILMLIPVTFKRPARQLKAVCCVNSRWLPWWRKFAHELEALSSLYKLRPSPG